MLRPKESVKVDRPIQNLILECIALDRNASLLVLPYRPQKLRERSTLSLEKRRSGTIAKPEQQVGHKIRLTLSHRLPDRVQTQAIARVLERVDTDGVLVEQFLDYVRSRRKGLLNGAGQSLGHGAVQNIDAGFVFFSESKLVQRAAVVLSESPERVCGQNLEVDTDSALAFGLRQLLRSGIDAYGGGFPVKNRGDGDGRLAALEGRPKLPEGVCFPF